MISRCCLVSHQVNQPVRNVDSSLLNVFLCVFKNPIVTKQFPEKYEKLKKMYRHEVATLVFYPPRGAQPYTIAIPLMVLAMTNVGSAIPALVSPKDQKNSLKVVVLPDLKLYQAAFPASYTHFQKFQMLFTRSYKVHFKNAPICILSFFLKIQIQEHEGEVGEEGARLDHGEEGEEKTTGTVRMQLRICNSTIFLFGMLSYDISNFDR